MGVNGNGAAHFSSEGRTATAAADRAAGGGIGRAGREGAGGVRGVEVSGNRLHADLHRLSEEHPGLCVAAEWLGPLGWTRFLWRRQ